MTTKPRLQGQPTCNKHFATNSSSSNTRDYCSNTKRKFKRRVPQRSLFQWRLGSAHYGFFLRERVASVGRFDHFLFCSLVIVFACLLVSSGFFPYFLKISHTNWSVQALIFEINAKSMQTRRKFVIFLISSFAFLLSATFLVVGA